VSRDIFERFRACLMFAPTSRLRVRFSVDTVTTYTSRNVTCQGFYHFRGEPFYVSLCYVTEDVTPAARLRAALDDAGWTQEQLAKATGIARETINGYASGRLGIGSKNGPRIARALRRPPDYFVSQEPPVPSLPDLVEKIERVEQAVESLRREILEALQVEPSQQRAAR
jgi:transcriptional regulator with XRE-family HTH domain